MAIALLVGGGNSAWAQGTWTAPAVPGIDPSTVDGTTTYYLYNVGSDAFVTYGMSWQSQAIARRLSSGDQAASEMHKMTATISDGKLSFHYNDVKDANRFLSDNNGENSCYVDTWTGDATKFTYQATTPSGAYTLSNVATGNALDVHWKYGGHLTGTKGQGFTSWAIIPESSVTDGSYAKYKERKQMYDVYQALVSANVVSSYTTELEAANAVYMGNSSTVAQLRSATRTLINAAAEDIASSINGNSLFDDADMWGNQALSTWTATAASHSDFGEYETYNITYDFNQTHDVPNGSYKIVFHSLFRNDGNNAAPRIIVTDGELDGGGTTATAYVPLFSSMSFAPTNVNSSDNMSVGKVSYFSDWTDAGIPNGRRSSADALAHTNAVATVDNFKVTNGKMNIRMIIDGASQWVNFQGFDIIFYGSTTGKLYRDLVELLETSNSLKDQVMNDEVKTALNTAISSYSGLTKSSTEEELEAAITAVTTANTNANTSIANYTEANTILTAASSLSSAGQTIYANNETVSAIQSAYTGRTLVALTDEQKTASSDALAAVKAWDELKAYADALVAVENTNAEANATLASAISTQNTAATGATTTAAVTTATSTLKTAMITYASAADPTNGNRFDLTFMIAVPDMTGLWTGAWGVVPEGWATEQSGGNFQVMQNNDADAEDGIHKVFTEYYYLENSKTWGNNQFNVYTTIDDLPVGTYTMSCYAFAKEQNYTSGAENPQVFFYANSTQGSLVNNSRLAEKSISFINDEQQDVKVGLKPLTGNTLNWMGIGYVKLYKEYTDNTTYDITTNISNADVAVTVDNEPATSAKALKTVTLTVSNITEGYVISGVSATYNDGEIKNLDVANPSTNVYTYQQPAYDVTVTINVVVDKSALNTAIADATAARTNEGEGVFQIPATAGETLATAIATALDVSNNANATVADVAGAVTAINTAKTTYEGTTLNAPDASTHYNLIVATESHAKNGNAVIIVPGNTSVNNTTGYGLNANNAINANLAQAVTFTQVSGNTYNISFETADGTAYLTYGTKNGSTADWSDSQIQATTNAANKGEFKIVATATPNVFNIVNTLTNTNIDCQAGGNIYTDETITLDGFSVAEATLASVGVSIDADVKYATRIFPFTPSTWPNGVVAYSCEAASGDILTLVEVYAPAANVPYILFAEGGSTGSISGWGTAGETSYTAGWLTGVYEKTDAPVGSYVLQNNNDKVAFYLVAEDEQPEVGANRCYLNWVESNNEARAFYFPENNATAIKTINALTSGKAEIFNASGVQIPALQKGMNIIRTADGKSQKVMVK